MTLGWVRLGLWLLLLTVLSWGSVLALILVGTFAVVAIADLRWHFREPVDAALDRLLTSVGQRIRSLLRRP